MGRRRKVIGALGAAAVIAVGLSTWEPSLSRSYSVVDVPPRDTAVILGCRPGSLLEQRMDAACALVESGKVRRLVLSGLGDEMPRMRERASQCHAEVVVDDGAARTLENLKRARDLHGMRAAIVVTQQFHMARALYLAEALGIDAVGAVAAGAPRDWTTPLRERLATARARIDVLLL